MTGKQLRNSILQWAIQGKLVPQDPNDEPASVLLERIREEKARLVKEKKIKKDKNESIIFRGEDNSYYEKFLASGEVKCIDDEVPFELPDGWEWARMGSIGDWGAGATPAKGNSSYYGGDILWLRTGELNDGVVYDTEIKVTQKALAECSLRINRVGDVLIAMYGATIGKVAIVGKELTTNQACCACTPYDIYKWFLFYFLMGSKDDFVKKGEGGAQPNISREKLIHHLMPIPPLAEQYRIVEKIKEVLPYIEQYESSQNSLNALNDNIKPLLKKSILQEAIQGRLVPQIEEEGTAEELLEGIRAEKKRLVKEGKQKASALKEESRIFKGADNKYHQNINGEDVVIDDILPFEIPSKWCWVSLGELVSDRTGLSYKKESLSDRTEPFVRVLRGGNIEDGEMLIKADDVMISSSYVSADLLLKKGMYISPAVSSLEKIGKTALVAKNYNDTVVGGFVLMLLPLFNDEWLGQYLYYFFQTGYYHNYCRTITKKSGQAFYNLSRPKLILCPVPLPPKQEIPRIVERLNIVLASIMRG